MSDRRYVYSTDEGWSKPVRISRVMAVAGRRIVLGSGPYSIVRDGKATNGDLSRAEALARFRRVLVGARLGTVVRARNRLKVRVSAKQVRTAPTVDPRRTEMVRWCRWGIAHAGAIHYSQARPFRTPRPGTLPLSLDCSGSTILFASWAGAPNPSGSAPGYGNSSTIAAHARQISRSSAQAGDIVVFGISPTTHVAVVLEMGPDPLMFSHGKEEGPYAIRLSVEARYHPGQPVRFFSLL